MTRTIFDATTLQVIADTGFTPVLPSGDLQTQRANAAIPRAQFLTYAVANNWISAAVAVEAAGGNWPAAFDAFLAGLSVEQQIAAKETWATGLDVRRNAPLLAQIAAANDPQVTDAQLDTMFGIA